MSYRKILVGFDGSEHARDALALGELLARATGAQLTAACVYVYRPVGAGHGGETDYERYLRDEARATLAAATALAGDPPASLETVAAGSPAEGLHRLAEEREIDLVVVGSSHVGAVGRVMAGSVPERLLHGAPCAVAIAPRGFGAGARYAPTTIGVAFDGSAESRAAVDAAAELARASGARLRVIHANQSHIGALAPAVLAAPDWGRYEATLHEDELRELHEAVDALEDVSASAEPADGDAASVLTARSHELDLLVLGSRSYGPLRRVLLGSVSTLLARQAACPLLIVPRGAVESTATSGGDAGYLAAGSDRPAR